MGCCSLQRILHAQKIVCSFLITFSFLFHSSLLILTPLLSLMNFFDNQRIHNLAVGLSRASKKYFEHSSLQIRKRIAIEAALLTTKLKDIHFPFILINLSSLLFLSPFFLCSLIGCRDGPHVTTHPGCIEASQG